MKRLIFALTRSDVRYEFSEFNNEYWITAYNDDSQIGYISFVVQEYEHSVFITKVFIAEPFRKTKTIIYLLEYFRTWIDQHYQNMKFFAYVQNPELEAWLRKLPGFEQIEFKNLNPLTPEETVAEIIGPAISRAVNRANINHDGNHIYFSMELLIQDVEECLDMLEIGHIPKAKKYTKMALSIMTYEEILPLMIDKLSDYLFRYFTIPTDVAEETLSELDCKLEISEAADGFIIKFKIPLEEIMYEKT